MPSESALAFGPAPLFLLLLALALDAYVGDPPGLYRIAPHPVALMGRAVAALERRLNRTTRGDRERFLRGVLAALVLIAVTALAGWLVSGLLGGMTFGWLVELVLVMTLLAQRDLYLHVAAVAQALETGGLGAGREAVSHIVGRDPATLDEHGVARGAIESCAENLADGVIAPVFWYALAGLPGIAAYKMINTLDSMIGHRSPRYRAFGAAAARIDDAVNYIPARIAGLILALAAAIGRDAAPRRALAAMWRDAGKHRSVNAGWPEAAMAGALDIALAGPRRYAETVVRDAWMGSGRARVTAVDIRRSLRLYVIACLITAGIVGALGLADAAMG